MRPSDLVVDLIAGVFLILLVLLSRWLSAISYLSHGERVLTWNATPTGQRFHRAESLYFADC